MTDTDAAKPPSTDGGEREASRAAAKRIDRVNDWLCLGGAIPPEEFQRFAEARITHIVDLREGNAPDDDSLKRLKIVRKSVSVPDRNPPSTEQLVEAARWFGDRNRGMTVYVHCKGGFGRAATMAVGLLVLDGHTLNGALEQVRAARPEMRLNEAQLEWLQSVEQLFASQPLRDLGR